MRKDFNLISENVRDKPYRTVFAINKTSPLLLKKINNLYNLLLQGKRKYERLATGTDRDLRRAILSLAQASNQYACELSSQIQMLGGISLDEKNDELESGTETKILNDENEVLSFCMAYEKRMVKAYHEILNEPFLYEGLRSMIHYQLNGILRAFTQVKELNSLMIHHTFAF
jgi:hypothetical protein